MNLNDRVEGIGNERSIVAKSTERKNKIPPSLKLSPVESVGEKSPTPATVYDLFKKYHKSDSVKPTEEDNMNVGFDKLSTDEKNGFLRKLQMLTVGSKKSSKVDESTPSPANRLLKKIVPSRRTSTEHPNSSNRMHIFGSSRTTKKSIDSERNSQRKKSARRLNFERDAEQKKDSTKTNNSSFVAEMTREYEKIVISKGAPVPINKANRNLYRNPRGSLETPTDSPQKGFSSSTESSPSDSMNQFPSREHFTSANEESPMKRKNFQQEHGNKNRDSDATWFGELPPRDYTSPTFSRKIFVGGVPWDITEAALKDSFGEFGSCAVEWPGQEARYRSGQSNLAPSNGSLRAQTKYTGQAATGYVYMIFEDERAVASLLHECSQEIGGAGEWYFKIRAQRSKSTEIRQVQIIPWVTSDSMFCEDDTLLETGIEPKRTVFVGALHGMMTAQVLHSIMEDCFGAVECVQLDTDKFKYPIGSGRVTFREHGAYFKAIEMGYLHVYTSKFRKRVQIDPFLESTCCMVCNSQSAHCFCRNKNCFKYYCHNCWALDHGKDDDQEVHIPVIVPSSASKAFPGATTRRSQVSSSLSLKNGSNNSQVNNSIPHFPSAGFPIIVGAPAQTLSALYGYIQNGQQLLKPAVFEPPMTPSPSEINKNRRSFTEFSTPPTVFFNSTPVISPQKSVSDGSPLPAYYNSAAFLTPPPTYYGSPNHPTSSNISQPQQPYYGANLYYGFIPPQQHPSAMMRSPNYGQ